MTAILVVVGMIGVAVGIDWLLKPIDRKRRDDLFDACPDTFPEEWLDKETSGSVD